MKGTKIFLVFLLVFSLKVGAKVAIASHFFSHPSAAAESQVNQLELVKPVVLYRHGQPYLIP